MEMVDMIKITLSAFIICLLVINVLLLPKRTRIHSIGIHDEKGNVKISIFLTFWELTLISISILAFYIYSIPPFNELGVNPIYNSLSLFGTLNLILLARIISKYSLHPQRFGQNHIDIYVNEIYAHQNIEESFEYVMRHIDATEDNPIEIKRAVLVRLLHKRDGVAILAEKKMIELGLEI